MSSEPERRLATPHHYLPRDQRGAHYRTIYFLPSSILSRLENIVVDSGTVCPAHKFPNFARLVLFEHIYRVTLLLANLGGVDFDFFCSTLCLVLPGLMGNWQNWLSSWARWLNIPKSKSTQPRFARRCVTLYNSSFSFLPLLIQGVSMAPAATGTVPAPPP